MIGSTENGAEMCTNTCGTIIQVPSVEPTSTLQSLWVSVWRANWITAQASSTGALKSSQVLTLKHARAHTTFTKFFLPFFVCVHGSDT
jgi:hypothetical protein